MTKSASFARLSLCVYMGQLVCEITCGTWLCTLYLRHRDFFQSLSPCRCVHFLWALAWVTFVLQQWIVMHFPLPQSIAVALLLGLPFSLIFPLYNIKMMTCESGEHCHWDTKRKTQQTNNRQSSSIALVTHTVLFSCGKQTRGDSFFVLSYLFSADINYYLKRAVANKSANNSAFYSSQFATATSSSPTLSCTLSCLCLLQQINIFRYSCVSRINWF